VHSATRSLEPPVTTAVHGPGLTHRLGMQLPVTDLMLGAARARRIVVGAPDATAVHRAGAERLGGGIAVLKGIAMCSIHLSGELYALLELGRTDHPFRAGDEAMLREVGDAITARLERMLG
jgi:hypothetical protein